MHMTEYIEASNRLVDLALFLKEHSIPVPEPQFTGTLGEWLTMHKLLDQGYEPVHESGQSDVDIILNDGTGVEVKSGQYDEKDRLWRFDNIQPEKFDYLACVQFHGWSTDVSFYIFSPGDTDILPPRNRKAFTDPDRDSNTRLIRIYDELGSRLPDDHRTLNESLHEYREAWEKLPAPSELVSREER